MAKHLFFTRKLMVLYLCLWGLVACSSVPNRQFATYELLIGQEIIPENWRMVEYAQKTLDNEGQEDGSYIIFQKSDAKFFARGGEDIYRYDSRNTAQWHYERFRKLYLEKGAYDLSNWETPGDFHFKSTLAENWRFACVQHQEILRLDNSSTSVLCQYLAQYDEFLVSFSIKQQADGQQLISLQDIEKIIKAIDQQMVKYLK
jgi:hypothetical protein